MLIALYSICARIRAGISFLHQRPKHEIREKKCERLFRVCVCVRAMILCSSAKHDHCVAITRLLWMWMFTNVLRLYRLYYEFNWNIQICFQFRRHPHAHICAQPKSYLQRSHGIWKSFFIECITKLGYILCTERNSSRSSGSSVQTEKYYRNWVPTVPTCATWFNHSHFFFEHCSFVQCLVWFKFCLSILFVHF